MIAALGGLFLHHHGQAALGGLALHHIVGLAPLGHGDIGGGFAVRGLVGEGHHVGAKSVHGLGDAGLFAVFVGLKGVVIGLGVGQAHDLDDLLVQQLVGHLVGLVLHDDFHAAGHIAAGQIAVQHGAVARGHVVHGVFGHRFIGVAGAGVLGVGHAALTVVDDGLGQLGVHGGERRVVAALFAPLVGVRLEIEGVIALFQHIAALAVVVEGSQVVGAEGKGQLLRSAGLQGVGLGKGDQHHLGFLQATALDAEVLGVALIGGVHIELHHFLAGHVAGVGDLHGDGILTVGLQLHVGGGDLLGEGGVAQAVAEGELHHLLVAGGGAVFEGVGGEGLGVEVAHRVGSFKEAVAHVDAFLVLIEGVVVALFAVGVAVVVHVVEGGIGGHVIGPGVHQAAGGVHRAGEQLADAHKARVAGMAHPQAGFHVVLLGVEEAQLHGGGGVDKHDGVLKVLLAEIQQVFLVLVQLQVGGAVDGAAVAVQVHGEGAALGGGTGEGDHSILVVAVHQDAGFALFVDAGGELMDGGVAVPVAHAGGIRFSHAALAAAHLLQPFPGGHVHVQPGFDEGGVHHDGVFLVAAHIVVGHGAQQRHLGAAFQREDVVVVFQKHRALGDDLHAGVVAFHIAVVHGVFRRERARRQGGEKQRGRAAGGGTLLPE